MAAGRPSPAWERPLTSIPFAALQLGLLGALAAAAVRGPLRGMLLVLLGASTLAVAWARRPYDRARLGFLLVHGGAAILLLALAGPPWARIPGLAALGLGIPWMFYLKPRLRAQPGKALRPAWERAVLQGTRVLFLAAGAGLILPLLGRAPLPAWLLASWFLLAVALHLHHVKALKGPKAQAAGLAAWGLCLAAYLCLR